MSPFTILVLCVQTCLIQVAFVQCGCSNNLGLSNINLGSIPYGSNLGSASSAFASASSNFGGIGTGQAACAGDVTAYGETVVVGCVPVIGDAGFCGNLPATGSVSIAGQCGCGCA